MSRLTSCPGTRAPVVDCRMTVAGPCGSSRWKHRARARGATTRWLIHVRPSGPRCARSSEWLRAGSAKRSGLGPDVEEDIVDAVAVPEVGRQDRAALAHLPGLGDHRP